jgi:hypothetical protein
MAKVEIHQLTCDRCGAAIQVPAVDAKPAGSAIVPINLVEIAGESTVVQSSTGGSADICPACTPPPGPPGGRIAPSAPHPQPAVANAELETLGWKGFCPPPRWSCHARALSCY